MSELTVKKYKLKISLIIYVLSDNSHFIIKSHSFFLFFLHLSPICFKCWLNFNKKTSELSQVIPKSKESHFPLSQRIKLSKLLYSLYIGVILRSIFATDDSLRESFFAFIDAARKRNSLTRVLQLFISTIFNHTCTVRI